WNMWRATGGALADSMWYYVTWQNVLWMIAVVATGAAAPLALRGVPQWPIVGVLAAIVLLGPAASRHTDTRGLERNAISAIITTSLPRLAAGDVDNLSTATGFDRTRYEDLTRLRGIAAGR